MPYNFSVAPRAIYINYSLGHNVDYELAKSYHKALDKQIMAFAEQYNHKLAIDAIFIDASVTLPCLDQLLLDTSGTLDNVFAFHNSTEVTIEVDSGVVKPEQLCIWRNVGINRVCFRDSGQSTESVYSLIQIAQDHFTNISIELVDEVHFSVHQWQSWLKKVVTWPIHHITLNAQVIECDLYQWMVDLCALFGFVQYETVHFARSGYESKYMQHYWQREPYKGFGIGAESFDGAVRYFSVKNLASYLECMKVGSDVTDYSYCLSSGQAKMEKLMMGFRQKSGVALDFLYEEVTPEKARTLSETIAYLESFHFLVRHKDRIVLTPRGQSVHEEIILKLSI